MTERVDITDTAMREVLALIERQIERRLKQKGRGGFVSKHEALGIIVEEYDELLEAVRNDRDVAPFLNECVDIAVACLIAVMSFTSIDAAERERFGKG